MLKRLIERERSGEPIRVGLIGAGSMGLGIAHRIACTPGMRLVFVGDVDAAALERVAAVSGLPCRRRIGGSPDHDARVCVLSDDPLVALADEALELEVLVEASNSVGAAARYCRLAIARGVHVVLMNAEVDLAFGPLLAHEASRQGCVVTSDGGDQHGVLKRLIDDIALWGLRVVQAGNIKGFLDRYATAAGLAEEAAKRRLNPIQCCAYTDGTKLNIEMALIANGVGLSPGRPGMSGPACRDVHEVMTLFDFDAYGETGRVDYILGAAPGGGVYVVAHCDDPVQVPYLQYYKLGEGPYYLFYRPYHLCHLETPRVIAEAVLDGSALLQPECGLRTDVFAYAKIRIPAGASIRHAIGSDCCYGLIDTVAARGDDRRVPIVELEGEDAAATVTRRDIAKDQAITRDDIEIPDSYLIQSRRVQARLLEAA